MGIDSEIAIIKSCEEEKYSFKDENCYLWTRSDHANMEKMVCKGAKKRASIPTTIWKPVKRYSRPKNRQAWTQKAVALHKFSYTHQHLYVQKALFLFTSVLKCFGISSTSNSSVIYFYREFPRKSLTMFNLIYFLNTQ